MESQENNGALFDEENPENDDVADQIATEAVKDAIRRRLEDLDVEDLENPEEDLVQSNNVGWGWARSGRSKKKRPFMKKFGRFKLKQNSITLPVNWVILLVR